jgi:hypothetical protein
MTTCLNGGLGRTQPGEQNCRSGAAPTAMRIGRDYRHIGGSARTIAVERLLSAST